MAQTTITFRVDDSLKKDFDKLCDEFALSKEDSFLVTGNIKHFPEKPFIVTPAEMLTIINEMTAGPGRILNDPAPHTANKNTSEVSG